MRNTILAALLLLSSLAHAGPTDPQVEQECMAFAKIVHVVVMHRIEGHARETIVDHLVTEMRAPIEFRSVLEPIVAFVYNPELQIREASDVAAIVAGSYNECVLKAEDEKKNLTT